MIFGGGMCGVWYKAECRGTNYFRVDYFLLRIQKILLPTQTHYAVQACGFTLLDVDEVLRMDPPFPLFWLDKVLLLRARQEGL